MSRMCEKTSPLRIGFLCRRPSFFFGSGFIVYGVCLILWNVSKIYSRKRVMGIIVGIEEVTDFGLSDSTQRIVVRYVDEQGATQKAYTKPRVTIGGYVVGKRLPVYVSKNANTSPFVGGFQEMWLFSLVALGFGVLCLALAYV